MNFNLKNFKKEKSIIFFSSIIFVLSIFLWDIKFEFFQTKYLISTLLIYNLILYKKSDLNYYLYILGFCFLLLIHLLFQDNNILLNKYIIFSLLFLFIYISVLFKLAPFFDKILAKSVTIFIFLMNILFFLELIFFDYYMYDKSQINGLCTLCIKDNYFIFDKFFSENSHVGMMSAAIILYGFIQFTKINNFEKISLVVFTILNFILSLSLTLILGVLLSSFVLLIMGALKNFKEKIFILFPIVISLFLLIELPNCWIRIYQVLNLQILYEKTDKNNQITNLGTSFSSFKKNILNPTPINAKLFDLNLDINLLFDQKLMEFIKLNNEKLSYSKNIEELGEIVKTGLYKYFSKSQNPEKIEEFKSYVKESVGNKFNVDETIILNENMFDKFIFNSLYELKKTNYYLNSSINVTTIVHLNHYMVAFNALKLKSFGYGFQNYEKASMEFAKKNKLMDDYNMEANLNKNDGSNNFNKLLVEFSYLNILLVVLFFIFNFKTNLNNPSKVFIFSIIITQLFRAAGYFNGGFLFVIVMGFFSIFIKQKK